MTAMVARTRRARVIACGRGRAAADDDRRGLPATPGVDAADVAWGDRDPQPRHCDDCIHDHSLPICLRVWLLAHRLPAADGALLQQAGMWPRLYADHRGRRVRVTMASRLGDLGISHDLARESGYEVRGVAVADLSNFSTDPGIVEATGPDR